MIFRILIQLCVCLSVCWCSSDCVCGSLVGKNYACGIETFSCSVSDPTTVILVRKKCPSLNHIFTVTPTVLTPDADQCFCVLTCRRNHCFD